MDNIDVPLISLLEFLLPGFVAAWIFYALSSYPKPSQFERIIQALIYTVLVQGMSHVVKLVLFNFGGHLGQEIVRSGSGLMIPLTSSILFGLVVVYFSNNDKFHKFLRWINITRETSYASEWFGTFSDNITYVVLHLDGGRRIYGWPTEWPTEPEVGHFVLRDASWLDENNNQTSLDGVGCILIRGSDVQMVEFMKPILEVQND